MLLTKVGLVERARQFHAPLALFLLLGKGDAVGGIFLALGWCGWVLFHVLLADSMEGGQSWGKRVAGTRVVDAISGAPCTLLQSFIRRPAS